MGILWRLLAPKPLKRARRTVRKATHPVHTVVRAATPKSVKKLQRAAHPLSLAELKTEDAIVNTLQGKRRRRPARKPAAPRQAAGGVAPARPVQPTPRTGAPRTAAQHLQAQAPAAEPPRAEASYPPRNEQRQAQIADHYARRQARIGERDATRQAKTAGREAVYRVKTAARQQRKAAFKAARGPWRWPEWSLITGAAALIAWLALVGVADGHLASGPGVAAIPVFLIWILAALIAAPAVLWRRHRARHAAAAVLASAGQSPTAHQAPPPGPQT